MNEINSILLSLEQLQIEKLGGQLWQQYEQHITNNEFVVKLVQIILDSNFQTNHRFLAICVLKTFNIKLPFDMLFNFLPLLEDNNFNEITAQFIAGQDKTCLLSQIFPILQQSIQGFILCSLSFFQRYKERNQTILDILFQILLNEQHQQIPFYLRNKAVCSIFLNLNFIPFKEDITGILNLIFLVFLKTEPKEENFEIYCRFLGLFFSKLDIFENDQQHQQLLLDKLKEIVVYLAQIAPIPCSNYDMSTTLHCILKILAAFKVNLPVEIIFRLLLIGPEYANAWQDDLDTYYDFLSSDAEDVDDEEIYSICKVQHTMLASNCCNQEQHQELIQYCLSNINQSHILNLTIIHIFFMAGSPISFDYAAFGLNCEEFGLSLLQSYCCMHGIDYGDINVFLMTALQTNKPHFVLLAYQTVIDYEQKNVIRPDLLVMLFKQTLKCMTCFRLIENVINLMEVIGHLIILDVSYLIAFIENPLDLLNTIVEFVRVYHDNDSIIIYISEIIGVFMEIEQLIQPTIAALNFVVSACLEDEDSQISGLYLFSRIYASILPQNEFSEETYTCLFSAVKDSLLSTTNTFLWSYTPFLKMKFPEMAEVIVSLLQDSPEKLSNLKNEFAFIINHVNDFKMKLRLFNLLFSWFNPTSSGSKIMNSAILFILAKIAIHSKPEFEALISNSTVCIDHSPHDLLKRFFDLDIYSGFIKQLEIRIVLVIYLMYSENRADFMLMVQKMTIFGFSNLCTDFSTVIDFLEDATQKKDPEINSNPWVMMPIHELLTKLESYQIDLQTSAELHECKMRFENL